MAEALTDWPYEETDLKFVITASKSDVILRKKYRRYHAEMEVSPLCGCSPEIICIYCLLCL